MSLMLLREFPWHSRFSQNPAPVKILEGSFWRKDECKGRCCVEIRLIVRRQSSPILSKKEQSKKARKSESDPHPSLPPGKQGKEIMVMGWIGEREVG